MMIRDIVWVTIFCLILLVVVAAITALLLMSLAVF